MRILLPLLPLVALLSATACSNEPAAPEQPTAEQLAQQAAVPAEPQLPGMSELKGALIGGCPKVAMRLADVSCSEAEGDSQFACTYRLYQDEAEHSASIAAEGEDWELVDVPAECTTAG